MEHIQARFNQIIHKKRIVTAGMQPEMHSSFMGITDNFLIQREIQFPENLRRHHRPVLMPQIIGGENAVKAGRRDLIYNTL